MKRVVTNITTQMAPCEVNLSHIQNPFQRIHVTGRPGTTLRVTAPEGYSMHLTTSVGGVITWRVFSFASAGSEKHEIIEHDGKFTLGDKWIGLVRERAPGALLGTRGNRKKPSPDRETSLRKAAG